MVLRVSYVLVQRLEIGRSCNTCQKPRKLDHPHRGFMRE
ncbi:BnaCnng71240D, partial [Brassica napus]